MTQTKGSWFNRVLGEVFLSAKEKQVVDFALAFMVANVDDATIEDDLNLSKAEIVKIATVIQEKIGVS